LPASRSACRTQFRSVSPEQPIFSAIDWMAAHCEEYSLSCSNTIRTARSRTSGEYFFACLMTPISQRLEPPANPGRFKPGAIQITDDRVFGEVLKNYLFDLYLRSHRNAEELIKRGRSKTLEFRPSLRSSPREGRTDDDVTYAVLETIAAFLNTEGGDLLIGVAEDGAVVGVESDGFESDDRFVLHLAQVVRNALGDRAGTCIDPRIQIVKGKAVCVVSCQRSPEPVFLKREGTNDAPEGDF